MTIPSPIRNWMIRYINCITRNTKFPFVYFTNLRSHIIIFRLSGFNSKRLFTILLLLILSVFIKKICIVCLVCYLPINALFYMINLILMSYTVKYIFITSLLLELPFPEYLFHHKAGLYNYCSPDAKLFFHFYDRNISSLTLFHYQF